MFAHLALNLAENLLSTYDKSINSIYAFWPSVRWEASQKASAGLGMQQPLCQTGYRSQAPQGTAQYNRQANECITNKTVLWCSCRENGLMLGLDCCEVILLGICHSLDPCSCPHTSPTLFKNIAWGRICSLCPSNISKSSAVPVLRRLGWGWVACAKT